MDRDAGIKGLIGSGLLLLVVIVVTLVVVDMRAEERGRMDAQLNQAIEKSSQAGRSKLDQAELVMGNANDITAVRRDLDDQLKTNRARLMQLRARDRHEPRGSDLVERYHALGYTSASVRRVYDDSPATQ